MNRMKDVLSGIKITRRSALQSALASHGELGLFNANTTKPAASVHLSVWPRFYNETLKHAAPQTPRNGFEELIQLTEQGKLWQFPIDNEQGIDTNVPFHEHVFLDHLLEDFPRSGPIRDFMGFIVSGLAGNHWMSVERKHAIIKWYKDYFESKKEYYEAAGFKLN